MIPNKPHGIHFAALFTIFYEKHILYNREKPTLNQVETFIEIMFKIYEETEILAANS